MCIRDRPDTDGSEGNLSPFAVIVVDVKTALPNRSRSRLWRDDAVCVRVCFPAPALSGQETGPTVTGAFQSWGPAHEGGLRSRCSDLQSPGDELTAQLLTSRLFGAPKLPKEIVMLALTRPARLLFVLFLAVLLAACVPASSLSLIHI